jgi:hypothetical protein
MEHREFDRPGLIALAAAARSSTIPACSNSFAPPSPRRFSSV